MRPSSPFNEHDVAHSQYEHLVRRLYSVNLFHPVKLGLDNMHELHRLLGNPMDQSDRIVVHVAGTNGKGSVSLKIANTLQSLGLRVGLFCSPHVSTFRERMQLNGELISEEEVVELLPKIFGLCVEHDIPATFFELTTALAFAFYAMRDAQVVVLETGLGGRLDATNVIQQPAISVITSIGLEHTRILGETIELIAKEKAGIMKPGCPVLVGPHCPQEVMRDCALEKQCGNYYVPQEVLQDDRDTQVTDYDEENSRIAKAALMILQQSFPEKLKSLTPSLMDLGTTVRPPCRFEQVDRDGLSIVLDVAHNPPAMDYLTWKLRSNYGESARFRFVVGMSSDKDFSLCGQSLLAVTDPSQIHLVQASHPRAGKVEEIIAEVPALNDSHFDLEDRSISKQVLLAQDLAKKNDEILVVCGSVFLMAEAREALGFDEPRDSDFIAAMAGSGLMKHGQEIFGNTPPPTMVTNNTTTASTVTTTATSTAV
eukprot:Nitzschia sp. Nitz4//scaffold298_size22859//19255//20811//NITZ4_008533-RA/size22859-augustus-gene-0.2-mRNA-1//1//CDS//3329546335//2865//frame0